MNFTTPEELLQRVAAARELETGACGPLLLHRACSLAYFSLRDLMPTERQYEAAGQCLSTLTGLRFSAVQAQNLLSLFPFVRIALAQGELTDTLCHDLADAAAYFLLGCRWPLYQDQVDMRTFLEVLRYQGVRMGFERLGKNPAELFAQERRAAFPVVEGGRDS